MNKVVLISDSFKHSLSSIEICSVMENAVLSVYPNCKVIKIPVSDGGEGLSDCFLSIFKGQKQSVITVDPFGNGITSTYALLDDGTAVIELAASCGLRLVRQKLDPSTASTFGFGKVIRHAIEAGAKKIILGVGDSATNDAGTGLASALGVRFYDQNGNQFVPNGGTLGKIADISISDIIKGIDKIAFSTLCDVKNPLYGTNGAAYVFGRQKGADNEMIAMLDRNLRSYSHFLKNKYGFSTEYEGAGAAGGTTIATKLFLNSQIKRGINTVLEMVDFASVIKNADVVFTGEGRLDKQSFQGKVIDGIANYTAEAMIPLIALVGQISGIKATDYPKGLTAVYPLLDVIVDLDQAIKDTAINMMNTMIRICKDWDKAPCQ
ncbi:MAG: glycerate kinase [Candidatus Izemoplasmatales bacterium]|jgi:glycerate kinase|nr:glycerate kinase [Candidatus Izemoplasmatales bacterium]